MTKSIVKKQIFTAMLASISYVLSTFVSFPRMAPFQHFINVIGAVFLGPVWGFNCALMTGLMRMILNGSTILAVIGELWWVHFYQDYYIKNSINSFGQLLVK